MFPLFFLCVCMFVFVGMYASCMHVSSCEVLRSALGVVSEDAFHVVFGDRVSC